MIKKKVVLYKLKKSLYTFTIAVSALICTNKLQDKMSKYLNKKYYKEYDNMVNNFSDVLTNNELNDIYSIFLFTEVALKDGCFSKYREFEYSLDRDIVRENPGIVNVTGKGVCMNEAAFLRDVYKSCGYESSLIYCTIKDENYNIIPNHVITSVCYNDEYYYFDITNSAALIKKDNFTLYNDVFNYTIEVNPVYNLVFDDNNSYISQLTSNNTNYKNIKSYFLDYDEEFPLNEIYEENKPSIDYINDNFDKIKKNSDMSYVISYSLFGFLLLLYFGNGLTKRVKAANLYDKLIDDIEIYLKAKNCTNSLDRISLLCDLYDNNYITYKNTNDEYFSKCLGIKENYLKSLYISKFKYLFLKEFITCSKIIKTTVNNEKTMLIEFKENDKVYLFNPSNNEYIVDHKGLNTNNIYNYISEFEYSIPELNNIIDESTFTYISEEEQEKINEIGKTLKLTKINE